MVSIIPSERSSWDLIGRSIGSNLNQNLPEYYQRQRGMQAIDQLQKDLSSSNGDYTKMATSLMRAYTQNPGLERSGLGQTLLNQAVAEQLPNALGTGSQGAGNTNVNPQIPPQSQIPEQVGGISQPPISEPLTSQSDIKSARDVDAKANEYIAQVRPDIVNPSTQYGAINTFDSAIKQDLTPEEESQLRQKLKREGYNPEISNQVVDRVRKGIETKYNEAKDKYGFDADKLKQIQGKWTAFSKDAEKKLDPFLGKYTGEFPGTKDLLTNKYFQYAGSQPTNMTPEQMHSNAIANLQKDINKLDALSDSPAMPPIHTESQAKDYLDSQKSVYKDLYDQGYGVALKEDALLNKDMGNEEFHELIFGDNTSKPLLNSIHSLKAPQEYTTYPHPQYNKNYPKEHDEYMTDLSNKLQKLGPNDDLILSRAMVLDNNGTIKDFTDALSMAQKKGLKLSPLQQSQLQEVNIPRRPPLWEIFSKPSSSIESLPFGVAGVLNWKPFINYVRGKR